MLICDSIESAVIFETLFVVRGVAAIQVTIIKAFRFFEEVRDHGSYPVEGSDDEYIQRPGELIVLALVSMDYYHFRAFESLDYAIVPLFQKASDVRRKLHAEAGCVVVSNNEILERTRHAYCI